MQIGKWRCSFWRRRGFGGRGAIGEPAILSAEEKYAAIVERLQDNRFRILLEKHRDLETLKREIKRWLQKNGTEYDKEKLKGAFEYVEGFYRGQMRRDGITPTVAHAYSVALGVAALGGDFESVLTAIFHDTLEDCMKGKGDDYYGAERRMRMVRARVLSIGGERVLANVEALTHDKRPEKNESYEDYLRRVYSSNNVFVMVIKAVDTLENLKTLYFGSCTSEFKEATLKKALFHVNLWRKTNRQFFELMLELIKGAGVEGLAARIKSDLETPSLAQLAMEKDGYAFVNWRGEITYSLLLSLPNAGSPVLIVYKPEAMQEIDYIEIEFPGFLGRENEARKLLKKHLGWMEFSEVPSRLPENLKSAAIFRARREATEERERFLEGIEKIGREMGKQHRRERNRFHSFELLA